ncbi:MAG: hypothetical protein ACMUJM_05030 [bacterium]
MLRINWIPAISSNYIKGMDSDHNTYYYSSKKKLFLCITKLGILGAGKTAQEALDYAKKNSC